MQKEFSEWLEGRPKVIKQLAAKVQPWHRYKIKETGQYCNVYAYYEDGTVAVQINGHDGEMLNTMYSMMRQNVFGVNPDSLEMLESVSPS